MLQLTKQDVEELLNSIDLDKLHSALAEPTDEVAIELNEDEIEKILDSLSIDQPELRVKLQQFLTQLRFGDTP